MDRRGKLTIVCGGMFSGKSEEVVRQVKRAAYARKEVKVFKPKMDDRFANKEIVTHDGQRVSAIQVDEGNPAEILGMVNGTTRIVVIDEAQFFGPEIVEVAEELANRGYDVVGCGLDLDYNGKPFGSMPQLMAVAEEVQKKHAVCTLCGGEACRSLRIAGGDSVIELGAEDKYEPRCRKCFAEGK